MSLFSIAVFSMAMAATQTPVFRVSTEVVRVDVFVRRSGVAVTGLTRDDFEIYDEGKLRPVDSVSIESVPLNVMLVLDSSTSVEGNPLRHLQSAAVAFVEEIAEEDRAGLITFSHHLTRRSDLTGDVEALKRSLAQVDASGATCWRDSLFAALEALEPVRERPMVLLFTDAEDTYSWLAEEQMLPLVRRSNAVVYAVTRAERVPLADIRTRAGRAQWRRTREEHARRTRLLRQLTEESGGRLLETTSTERLKDVFLEILEEMKTRYVLTYALDPPVAEGWHGLEVRVKRRGVDVRARRGYYYEGR